jgi:hypothetical protein
LNPLLILFAAFEDFGDCCPSIGIPFEFEKAGGADDEVTAPSVEVRLELLDSSAPDPWMPLPFEMAIPC